jgi:hypothetical protein
MDAEIIDNIEFENTNQIVVEHGQNTTELMYRIIIGNRTRNEIIDRIVYDEVQPKNKFTLILKSAYSGRLVLGKAGFRLLPSPVSANIIKDEAGDPIDKRIKKSEAELVNIKQNIQANIFYNVIAFNNGNKDYMEIKGSNPKQRNMIPYYGRTKTPIQAIKLDVSGSGLSDGEYSRLEIYESINGTLVAEAEWDSNSRQLISMRMVNQMPDEVCYLEIWTESSSSNDRGRVHTMTLFGDSSYDTTGTTPASIESLISNQPPTYSIIREDGKDILVIDSNETFNVTGDTGKYEFYQESVNTWIVGYIQYNRWWMGSMEVMNAWKIRVTDLEIIRFNNIEHNLVQA